MKKHLHTQVIGVRVEDGLLTRIDSVVLSDKQYKDRSQFLGAALREKLFKDFQDSELQAFALKKITDDVHALDDKLSTFIELFGEFVFAFFMSNPPLPLEDSNRMASIAIPAKRQYELFLETFIDKTKKSGTGLLSKLAADLSKSRQKVMAEQRSLYQRQLSNLDHDLRPIMEELLDPKVTDIMVNPGGELWTKMFGEKTTFSGRSLDRESILRIIMSTAALIEKKVTKDQWNLTGVIPKYNARIEAFIEPTVSSPTFCLRKPTQLALSLDDYVRDARLSAAHEEVIVEAVAERANILVGGGTGTGKTTFLNALIAEVARVRPDDRLYIVEDTPEINCQARNSVSLVVAPNESIKAVRSALRYKPDRIIFGELRYGEVALEWLKASSTGHPGGMCTVHADSAQTDAPADA